MLRREKKADALERGDKERRRFRIAKLEERIAPSGKKNGWDNANNPHYTGNCTVTCFCSVY